MSTSTAYSNGRNAYGCPLLNQQGTDAVKNFDAILKYMTNEQRQAFYREREQMMQMAQSYATHDKAASGDTETNKHRAFGSLMVAPPAGGYDA